jgi:MerR family transcriptional regulator, light-induced transcriptional regulator
MSRTMNEPLDQKGLLLDISAVERETGLSKDVLRIWERRYGFPKPGRDVHGERRYTVPEVARLRAVKRLLDIGMRPGRIVRSSLAELDALALHRTARLGDAVPCAIGDGIVALLRSHDASGLQQELASLLMRQGLQRFVLDTMVPLIRTVGETWMRGELHIFEEHLCTEQLQIVLRTAINAFPRRTGAPRVLLTTLPGEPHGLGLLMVEALLVPEGAQCISLGVQTPLDDVRRAALAHEVDLVALSFSAAFSPRQAGEDLAALRRQLPPAVALWAGGAMTGQLRRKIPGVALIPDLAATFGALEGWRTGAAPVAMPAG